MLNETVISLLSKGLWETIFMTFASGFFGFALGLPVGILLFLTKKGQLLENIIYNRILSGQHQKLVSYPHQASQFAHSAAFSTR